MLFDSIFNESVEQEETLQDLLGDDTAVAETCFIVDEVAHLPEDLIKEFCKEGGVGEALVQEGKISRKTIVRLNKADDLHRRAQIGAMLAAKNNNDPMYKKYMKHKAICRELKNNILNKYATKGEKIAKQSQREFLSKKSALPKMFRKFHDADDSVADK